MSPRIQGTGESQALFSRLLEQFLLKPDLIDLLLLQLDLSLLLPQPLEDPVLSSDDRDPDPREYPGLDVCPRCTSGPGYTWDPGDYTQVRRKRQDGPKTEQNQAGNARDNANNKNKTISGFW